jgi:hypothetical protein
VSADGRISGEPFMGDVLAGLLQGRLRIAERMPYRRWPDGAPLVRVVFEVVESDQGHEDRLRAELAHHIGGITRPDSTGPRRLVPEPDDCTVVAHSVLKWLRRREWGS